MAPFSYYNACSHDPPIVHFTVVNEEDPNRRPDIGGHKDTLCNVRETGEFVINVVSEHLVEQMVMTAANVDPRVDEFELAGLTPSPSLQVSPPRVSEALAAFECELNRIIKIGVGNMVFGNVVEIYMKASIMPGNRVDSALLRPIGRLGGAQYHTVKDTYRLQRPD